jgi:hypothetical protein
MKGRQGRRCCSLIEGSARQPYLGYSRERGSAVPNSAQSSTPNNSQSDTKAEFSIVTRASSKAWIPELIAAAGAQVTETYIDFFMLRSATGTLGLPTHGLAGSFLTGAPLMT